MHTRARARWRGTARPGAHQDQERAHPTSLQGATAIRRCCTHDGQGRAWQSLMHRATKPGVPCDTRETRESQSATAGEVCADATEKQPMQGLEMLCGRSQCRVPSLPGVVGHCRLQPRITSIRSPKRTPLQTNTSHTVTRTPERTLERQSKEHRTNTLAGQVTRFAGGAGKFQKVPNSSRTVRRTPRTHQDTVTKVFGSREGNRAPQNP